MNDSSPPLEIPISAWSAATDALTEIRQTHGMAPRGKGAVGLIVYATAPPIVAAELRRLADELDVVREEMREVDDRTIRSSGLGVGIQRLRARADELDPQGGAA